MGVYSATHCFARMQRRAVAKLRTRLVNHRPLIHLALADTLKPSESGDPKLGGRDGIPEVKVPFCAETKVNKSAAVYCV